MKVAVKVGVATGAGAAQAARNTQITSHQIGFQVVEKEKSFKKLSPSPFIIMPYRLKMIGEMRLLFYFVYFFPMPDEVYDELCIVEGVQGAEISNPQFLDPFPFPTERFWCNQIKVFS